MELEAENRRLCSTTLVLGGSFLVMELINKLQQLHHIENL